ncbi:MAG: hypothetical protein L6R42_009641 [Xanthoria sp. 1 TBL-2021]|nr:MAG: hypothetical protein L6R42_009641 [Xanthoria sp. 1 TBL-2021]
MQDLHDLFTLGDANQGSTETSELFKGTEVRFNGVSQGATSTEAPPTNGGVDEGTSVRRMAGVASLEHFQGEEGEEVRPADSDGATNSDARVMEGIFARAGVHSALEHDQIINGKRVVAADPKMIEREARKVAAQAAQELKKAGDVARSVPVGTPTWTGQFGTAGRPEEQAMQRGFGRGRGGPASSSILAGLQQRQLGQGAAGANGRSSRQGTPGGRGSNFMRMIRDYLVSHGGKVYTQMLIDHFNRYCTSPDTTMEFKEMLKQIATLEKGSRGRGSWVLKDEYKPTASI